jgi:Ca2+-binding EF-hand superfamily protein
VNNIKEYTRQLKANLKKFVGAKPDMIKKSFDDFDFNGNGLITIDEFGALLAKMKISLDRKYIHPCFKNVDVENEGAITTAEWASFITS